MRPGIHESVDELIQRRRIKILHDDGSRTWKTTPSLWEMLTDSAGCTGGTGGAPSWASRLPISAAIVDLTHTITTTCREAAHDLAGPPKDRKQRDTPGDLRAIASNPGPDLDWWTTKIGDWATQARTALHLDPPRPRWARGTPCPACGQTHAAGNDGVETTRVPALGITWTGPDDDEYHPDTDWQVRAVTCGACQATWWRGDGLEDLVQQMLTANRNHHTLTDAAS